MNTGIKRSLLLSLLPLITLSLSGQPPVYKIQDLLHRIADADTVYVVNFWATWCKPCVSELPSLDSVHVRSKGTNRKVLLVSLDFSEDLLTRLVPFLQRNNVQSECVLLDESDGNNFIDTIDRRWSGAIPATLVKRGNKTRFHEGKATNLLIERLVSEVASK